MRTDLLNRFWTEKAKFNYLILASILLLFTFLGGRELWTQEHRWADIVFGMIYRKDYLHPYLGENNYYDKPLLSYWLIVFFTKLSGALTTAVLRLPSALSGLLAIWSIYQLGTSLKDKSFGLLSAWVLLTTFYFLFWARTSSADMLNLGGSLFAIAWYFKKRETTNFFDYSIFFLIIAITSLCKGLIGAIIPVIAVTVDLILQHSWKKHLRITTFLAAIPAFIIYFLPFWASSHFGNQGYTENGLYLVYRENILRYFKPFDHQGPIYTYFVFLPIYLLPWTLFFIPALLSINSRFKTLSLNSKWIAWTLLALFLFLTLSGSRRSYYVLPVIPFAILFTVDWMSHYLKHKKYLWIGIFTSYLILFGSVDVLVTNYYSQYGINNFTDHLKDEASKIQSWKNWNVVLLDGETKIYFYLQLNPNIKNYDLKVNDGQLTQENLLNKWPILKNKPDNTIFITRKKYLPLLKPYFKGYKTVESRSTNNLFVHTTDYNISVALIPPQKIAG